MRDVEIHDLVLRLPGVGRNQARAIAEDVARRLADAVPEWRESGVTELATVRVRLPAGARRSDLARLIAAQIAEALR
jgi:hypothetical protein